MTEPAIQLSPPDRTLPDLLQDATDPGQPCASPADEGAVPAQRPGGRDTPDEHRLTDTDYTAAVERLRGYREELDAADRTADANSLARAADLAALYEDRRWVDDPNLPPARADATGQVRPDSRNRFATWVEQVSPIGLRRRQTAHLLDAHHLNLRVSAVCTTGASGERSLRPLKALASKGHGDAIGKVWRRAVELAEGPPTAAQVQRARRDYLDQFSTGQLATQQRRHRCDQEAHATRRHFFRMLDTGQLAQAEQLLVNLRNDLLARMPEKPA